MPEQAASADEPFFPFTRGLVLRGDPRLRRLAPVPPHRGPSRVLGDATRSAWVLLHTVTLPEAYELATARPHHSGRRPELRVVLHPAGLARCPMVSSVLPTVRRGPAAQPLAVLDGNRAVLRDAVGDAWWVTTDADLVARAAATFEAVWAPAEPVLAPDEEPPFTPRMVQVALLLLQGATDRQVARRLRVSERTVSGDVRKIARRLGVTTRAGAIARISGAEVT